jgi:hypothetical protein
MKTTTIVIKDIAVNDLTANPFLVKYGIHKLSDFEVKQLKRYNLPPGQVIATADNSVLYNWEAIEHAKKVGMKKIAVAVIEGLDEDDVIQIVSVKNMRKKLSRYQLAELIIELRAYLDENPSGKAWKDEIPGNNVIEKVAFLLGYSYGMTASIQKIYKYNPGLLKKIDEGEMTFTQADELSSPPKKAATVNNVMPPACEEGEEDSAGEEENGSTSTPDSVATPEETSKPDQWRFAGEKQTVPCEEIASVEIVYKSGRKIALNVTNRSAEGSIDGKKTRQLQYSGGKFHPVDQSEFHVISTEHDKAGFQFISWNTEAMAA